ncbi:TB2/DP1, HVA22 family-domain-containing protein [Emericellopsis atlantica]|uniref:Protein YOP1 n=1 Tax=Emericellopsis atlantica TaxID=2614577 RepID=A0A9P7ZMM3_9HYPO|nr:TB2/DP1, HVA22 family-domain-containing protein [Emericellopsis atlantica]KAG9254726.1 TB2/DP1, HVA22 family-domain-containing protein [Emericellopsis atlantica]
MFDLFAMLLSSVASFLFPIFASYKALKTSDPAQLTPWLMYWVVFSVALLAESWLLPILSWVPFYGYARLLFLLYLILPQTQGARIIYEEHVHPFLQDNEANIDDFIASAHERLKTAGLSYLKQAIELIKTNVLGLPPSQEPPAPPQAQDTSPQGYTQSLLARFSVPAAKWTGSANAGADVYNLLASAVTAAATAAGHSRGAENSIIPPNLQSSGEKMTFIAAQREKLATLLSALDAEAQQLQTADTQAHQTRTSPMHLDAADEDGEPTQRPPSGLSAWSALSKSRSETDFEKIEADSEDEASLRRRQNASGGGGWMSWSWGAANDPAKSSGVDQ